MGDLDQYSDDFSTFEDHVWRQIQAFKANDPGILESVQASLDERLDDLADTFGDTAAADAVDQGADALVDVLRDTATWSVQRDKMWQNFDDQGYRISTLNDVRALPLEAIEETVDNLDHKYGLAALTEGAVTGAAGLPGMLADLPALVTLCLRAVNEYATYYGFDAEADHEKPVAIFILAAAASAGTSRHKIFERLDHYAESLNQPGGAQADVPDDVMSDIVQRLVARVVRSKAAESLPLVGALVGAGFNRQFVRHVCQTARRVYEQRWLMAHYSAKPPSD